MSTAIESPRINSTQHHRSRPFPEPISCSSPTWSIATQKAVERAAGRDGESLITIRRAKADLGVVSTKSKFNGVWYWELPQKPSSSSSIPGKSPGREKP